jgi:hypothetical protein
LHVGDVGRKPGRYTGATIDTITLLIFILIDKPSSDHLYFLIVNTLHKKNA